MLLASYVHLLLGFSPENLFHDLKNNSCEEHFSDHLRNVLLKIMIRPQLVKSLVIVIYFFETAKLDAVIINCWLLVYSYSSGKTLAK